MLTINLVFYYQMRQEKINFFMRDMSRNNEFVSKIGVRKRV